MLNVNQAEVEIEIIYLRNNIALKSVNEEIIWKFTGEKFLLLTLVTKHVFCYSGSTYLSESAFSTMDFIKNKLKNRITDVHLDQTLLLALSSYEPDYVDFSLVFLVYLINKYLYPGYFFYCKIV